MEELRGLILAATSSAEDDLAIRLQARSRYALPLANRALIRYGAEALTASGVRVIAVAVSAATVADVGEWIGDGTRFSARFHYIEVPDSATPLQMLLAARDELGTHPLIVHCGDALLTGGLAAVLVEYQRIRPPVLLVSERSRAHPELLHAGVRGSDRREHPLDGLDHVAPVAILSVDALRELDAFSAETASVGGTVAALAEAGMDVSGLALDGCWCYAPDCDHLLEGNRMILDQLPHIPPELEPDGVRIDGRVAIHPGAKIERVTIRGPAVIGGGAEVLDTFIGPYTAIGAGVQLEGAEIEHSIVLEGASVQHVGQRIEASVIGSGASITRDFGMPTAMRLRVGRNSTVMLG